MKRALLLSFAVFALAISVAHAVPARPLYVPPDPPMLAPTIDLAETVWVGRLYTDGEQVTFHSNGTLTYAIGGGQFPGTWRLTGDKLYFDINNFSQYQTTVVGDVIQGTGTNKGGQPCTPLLKRQRQHEKAQW